MYVTKKDLARVLEMDGADLYFVNKYNKITIHIENDKGEVIEVRSFEYPNVEPFDSDWEWASSMLDMDLEDVRELCEGVAKERVKSYGNG